MSNAETPTKTTEATKIAAAGYGFWCFDCNSPMLAETYAVACANAFTAGWKRIRGVDRCPSCAEVATDGR
jgi:hypothetical protein